MLFSRMFLLVKSALMYIHGNQDFIRWSFILQTTVHPYQEMALFAGKYLFRSFGSAYCKYPFLVWDPWMSKRLAWHLALSQLASGTMITETKSVFMHAVNLHRPIYLNPDRTVNFCSVWIWMFRLLTIKTATLPDSCCLYNNRVYTHDYYGRQFLLKRGGAWLLPSKIYCVKI